MTLPLLKTLAAGVAFCLPTCLTRHLFRLVGYKVGTNTRLPVFSFVYGREIELGNDVDIRPLVFISVAKLALGSNTIVSFGTQVKGEGGFYTGDNCFIGPHCIIHCDEDVRFGFYSGIGPRSTIYTHGSFLPVTRGYPAVFARVVLEDFVWTAMGVQFLPGSHVESNCIINPGVVVSGRVPAGTRLQLSREAVTRIDQSKLLAFARRSPEFHHRAIIRGFLESQQVRWAESDRETVFRCADGMEFQSDPCTNRIHLSKDARHIATYDLETFYATESRDRIHRSFLHYIRRRFGLTLRTAYQPRATRV